MSYKLDSMPSFGYIQKLNNGTSYLLSDLKDSGSANTAGVTIDFKTKCSFVGRFIIDDPGTSNQLNYHLGTNSSSYKGMIPQHGIDVYQQLGSEEAYRCDTSIAPAKTHGSTPTLSKDSHVQYWRLS